MQGQADKDHTMLRARQRLTRGIRVGLIGLGDGAGRPHQKMGNQRLVDPIGELIEARNTGLATSSQAAEQRG